MNPRTKKILRNVLMPIAIVWALAWMILATFGLLLESIAMVMVCDTFSSKKCLKEISQIWYEN